MDLKKIKKGDYEVTDNLVEKVEAEFLEEGIFAFEWELFCVRFSTLFDEYEYCTDSFREDVQEELEQYQSIRSVLEMDEKKADAFLDSVFYDGYREFEVFARTDEDVCFFGSANRYKREDKEEFFIFYNENGYPTGRQFPRNHYQEKQNELFSQIIEEFCGYSGEIVDFITKSDDMGEKKVFGDIRIRIFSKY